jgi:hypothetical protein
LPIASTVAAIVLLSATAAADDVRVRLAWGGGEDRTWQAAIAVSEGAIADPHQLGVEADEPGSIWMAGDPRDGRKMLCIQERSARNYDGVEFLVTAPPSAKLHVQFMAADEPGHLMNVEVPLADLAGEFVNKDVDKRGNHLLAMRAPGDSLRVRLARDNLVFGPGETFACTLEPHGLPRDKGDVHFKMQLIGGGREYWTQDMPDRGESIAVEVPLPQEEGVYDFVVTAIASPNWSQTVRQPLTWKHVVAERRVQLVVLSANRPPSPKNDREMATVLEIDPANPRWYEKIGKLPRLSLAKNRLPRSWTGPLGNNCSQPQRHALGETVLLKPNADSPDVSWEAYWLPIGQPGRPHILEIEYPSDVPQTLGVSILEPNAAGALQPLVVDAGFDNPGETLPTKQSPRWLRHRMIFWPRTGTPLLLMTNGRQHSPAVYGKIRVLAGGERLARTMPDRADTNRRLLAAYLDRPSFSETFGANECIDPCSARCLDDWWTFYEGGTRLVDYLHHAGYNGLLLGALTDGSTIYPSALLQPTPRHDSGVFFESAQDPVRKDALEMLMRLFDRENLEMIPTLEFAAPLPELEAIRRAGGNDAVGLEWIGPGETRLSATLPPEHGLAPYYNVLHPRVQQAMIAVVRELASRYAHHPSFAGVALRLSADGYAQLPGPGWGVDDGTIMQFERDTKLDVPGKGGPQRFAERAAFLSQEPQRRTWLEWRAAQLAKFYRRIYDEIAAIRPGSQLYLAGAGMFDGAEMEAELRPSLPRRTTMAAAMLRVGIDARLYRDEQQRIVLLRPERIGPEEDLGSRAADLEISQMADVDRYFQTLAASGSFFYHLPREFRVGSFDAKNPFKPSSLVLLSQPTPSAEKNRKRFVRGLATLDSQAIVDGGWTLPLGQEASTRDIAAAYRALPAIRFQTIGNSASADAAQPVVFRCGVHGGRTYLYAVNDAPFAATGQLHIEASPTCRIEELSGMRKIAPLTPDANTGYTWEVSLGPYDVVAVQMSDPNVVCSAAHSACADAVEAALSVQIRQLGARAAALRNSPPLDVVSNAGFEQPPTSPGQISGWSVTERPQVCVQLDPTQKHGGRQSVKIVSDGPVACLVSQPLAIPATGRLTVAVWLRVANAARQPPLRLALEGKLRGQDYYRFAPVGLSPNASQPAVPIQADWGQYVFQVDDLPLEGLSSVRARFDLMGPGEVWLDDVQVYDLTFSVPEMRELGKLLTLADVKLQNGQVGDCVRLLNGYWPRFLQENVALPASPAPVDTAAAKPSEESADKGEKPPERTGFLNRMKGMLPESLRF